MAVVLGARTEAFIDSLLRSLNSDVIRAAEAPTNALVVGQLQTNLGGGETVVHVSNGHLWPSTGRVTLNSGTVETVPYVQVLPVGRTGNQAPTWNGKGSPPEAILRLAPGSAVANAHTALACPVFVPPDNAGVAARAVDNGYLGTHDLMGFLRALKEDLTPGTLTVDDDDAALFITVDSGGAAAMGLGVCADLTTEFNSAGAADVDPMIPATEAAGEDYFAIGYAAPFGAVALTLSQLATDGTFTWQYWNGTTWATLSVTGSAANVEHLYAAGTVSWTIPTDWATTTSTLMTASGTGRDTTQRYYVRALVATLFTQHPIGSQGRLGMGINGVQYVGGFTASSHVGDTITMATGTAAGETAVVSGNTANALMVAGDEFSAIIEAGDTFTIETTNYDSWITELEAHVPAAYNSSMVRGSGDTSGTVNAMATTMVSALVDIIEQYGGTVPTNDASTAQLAREECRTTRLTLAAGATDTVITVEDASLLEGYTNITIGSTAAVISRINAGRHGQGPNTVTLTAAVGGGGEAIAAVVAPNPRGTVATGRRHLAPTPHAWGLGFIVYLNAAIAAIEAWTVPT